MKSTTVSIRGDKAIVNALAAYARQRNTTMADLVRDAVDAKYGNDLEPILSFFANGDTRKSQSVHKTRKESAR